MICWTACTTCRQGYEVLLETSDSELLRDHLDEYGFVSCPKGCGGKMSLRVGFAPGDRDYRRITGKELYAALHGLGTPDEIARDPTVVSAMLKSSRVVDVETEEAGTGVVLKTMKLENGVTLHFCGGPNAHVFKMTKEAR